jgi:D-threo-aldose 1-dehydrogenase
MSKSNAHMPLNMRAARQPVGWGGIVERAHGARLADAALQFPLAHPAVASIVLGATSAQEVRRNIAALSSKVPSGLWSDLKAEGLLESHVPVPVSP